MTADGWDVVLVDAAGTTLARVPRCRVMPIVDTLNDSSSTSVVLGLDDPDHALAVSLLDAVDDANPLPAIEAIITRGGRRYFAGPLFDARPNSGDGTCVLTARSVEEHFKRRVVGQLGVGFDNGALVNPIWSSSLTGWSSFRVTSGVIGAVPGGWITAGTSAAWTGPGKIITFTAPTGSPDDAIVLYQVLPFTAPSNRDITVRFATYFWIPGGGGFAPTTQRFGVLLGRWDAGVDPVTNYGLVKDRAASMIGWDALARLNQWVLHECELKIPAGEDINLLVAICPPQGTSYAAPVPVPLTGTDGMDYVQDDPARLAAVLVLHGQDATYAKTALYVGDNHTATSLKVNQTWEFESHTNIGQAIGDLAKAGAFDWWIDRDTRELNTATPRRGSYKPELRCTVTETQRNVAAIDPVLSWSSGSNAVEQQTNAENSENRSSRYIAGSATASPTCVLEEVSSPVRDTPPMLLADRAEERLAAASNPKAVTVTTLPGDVDRMEGLEVGDRTYLLCTLPGRRVDGVFRVVRREVHPENDSVVFTMNPSTP